MNDVPLIKTNSINDINTSLIAIKKQLRQLNEALGLVDVPDVDTSVFVKKSDVVDVVESGNMNPVTSNAVVPVDTVISGDMHSVTSNAVYKSQHNTNDVFQGNQGNFVMPNGLIIKCGICTGGSSNNDNWNITFSKAFPNALFQVFVTPSGFAATCPNGWYTVGLTLSGFNIFCQGNAPGNGFSWLAIGR